MKFWHRAVVGAWVFASLACQNDTRTGKQFLEISLVRLTVFGVQGVSSANVVAEPVSAATVTVFVRPNEIFSTQVTTPGKVRFESVFPSAEKPVHVWIEVDGKRVGILDLALSAVTIPVAIEVKESLPTVKIAASHAVIRGEISEWAPSAIGQRSEAHIRAQSRFGETVDTALAPLEDRYATASFFSGSGQTYCYCVDSDDPEDECAPEVPGKSVCTDPGGFASGASGFTLYVPRGINEIGFVERITETTTGIFVATGGAYYLGEYNTGATGAIEIEPVPEIDPAFDLCADGGSAILQLNGIDRRFVSNLYGGLSISLDLVSPWGLRLPLLLGEKWPFRLVVTLADTVQQVQWTTPFALAGAFADFAYEYAIEATTSRVGALGDRIVDTSITRTRIESDVAICRQVLSLPIYTTDFVRPNTAVSLDVSNPEFSWIGETAGVRELALETEDMTTPLHVWLFDPRRLEFVGSAVGLPNLALPAATYRLVYRVYPDAAPMADVLLRNANVLTAASIFQQVHTAPVYNP